MSTLRSTSPERAEQGAAELESRQLVPLVYGELRALAHDWVRRSSPDPTLQPTMLVHEVYLRLAAQRSNRWHGRTHFAAVASMAMRRLLCDWARRRSAEKRGRDWKRVTLAEVVEEEPGISHDVCALNEALEKLASLNERQSRIVELRFLGGLSVEETAEVLHVSPRTVKLDWRMARAWLLRELQPEEQD